MLKFFPECENCLLSGARRMLKITTEDQRIYLELWDELLRDIPSLAETHSTLEVARHIQKTIEDTTGVKDPFRSYKERYNRLALDIVSELKEGIEISADPLLMSLRLAIAGNIIDFVAKPEFDLRKTVKDSLQCELKQFDYPLLVEKIAVADHVLYLGDNAGEIVFDKLLVEQLLQQGKKVIFAVRGAPILNDATMEDARIIGLDKIVEVITTGSSLPGVVLGDCSREFVSRFNQAELILSKGQGNFEGLCDEKNPIFFLLKAKCAPIANALKVEVGTTVLQANTACV